MKIPVTAIAQYTFDKHFLLLKDSVFGSSLLLITLKLHLCINNVQQIQNSILCLALIGFDKNQFYGGRRTEFTNHMHHSQPLKIKFGTNHFLKLWNLGPI